ncbi:MAG: hypothetical protein ABI674_06120 [Spartobacteria bacterium]
MKHLVPVALVAFLLLLAGTQLWTSRCLRFLSAEQKALLVDFSSRSSGWFPLCLGVFAAFIFWFPGTLLHAYYWPGTFATYAAVPFLISAALSIVSLVRISRLALPHSFIRGVRLAAIIYHAAFLFLTCSIIYLFFTYAQSRNQHRQTYKQNAGADCEPAYDLVFDDFHLSTHCGARSRPQHLSFVSLGRTELCRVGSQVYSP